MANTHYDTLGVSSTATKAEIAKAYKKKALLAHPDRAKPEEREKATAKFQALAEAMQCLQDDDERKAYDARLWLESESRSRDAFSRSRPSSHSRAASYDFTGPAPTANRSYPSTTHAYSRSRSPSVSPPNSRTSTRATTSPPTSSGPRSGSASATPQRPKYAAAAPQPSASAKIDPRDRYQHLRKPSYSTYPPSSRPSCGLSSFDTYHAPLPEHYFENAYAPYSGIRKSEAAYASSIPRSYSYPPSTYDPYRYDPLWGSRAYDPIDADTAYLYASLGMHPLSSNSHARGRSHSADRAVPTRRSASGYGSGYSSTGGGGGGLRARRTRSYERIEKAVREEEKKREHWRREAEQIRRESEALEGAFRSAAKGGRVPGVMMGGLGRSSSLGKTGRGPTTVPISHTTTLGRGAGGVGATQRGGWASLRAPSRSLGGGSFLRR